MRLVVPLRKNLRPLVAYSIMMLPLSYLEAMPLKKSVPLKRPGKMPLKSRQSNLDSTLLRILTDPSGRVCVVVVAKIEVRHAAESMCH
jgi:hypothetical protein